MQVELADDIAERADIDLVRPHVTPQESRCATCLVHQLRLAREPKIDQFDHPFPPWHKDKPRPAGVVHQQRPGERPVANDKRVGARAVRRARSS
jgi:hypothetical protein